MRLVERDRAFERVGQQRAVRRPRLRELRARRHAPSAHHVLDDRHVQRELHVDQETVQRLVEIGQRDFVPVREQPRCGIALFDPADRQHAVREPVILDGGIERMRERFRAQHRVAVHAVARRVQPAADAHAEIGAVVPADRIARGRQELQRRRERKRVRDVGRREAGAGEHRRRVEAGLRGHVDQHGQLGRREALLAQCVGGSGVRQPGGTAGTGVGRFQERTARHGGFCVRIDIVDGTQFCAGTVPSATGFTLIHAGATRHHPGWKTPACRANGFARRLHVLLRGAVSPDRRDARAGSRRRIRRSRCRPGLA